MSPRFKDFLFSIFVAFFVMACVVVTWSYTYDTVLELKNAELVVRLGFFAILVIAYLVSAMLILEFPPVKQFQQDLTGYIRPSSPPPETMTDEQRRKHQWTVFVILAGLIQFGYVSYTSTFIATKNQQAIGWVLISFLTLIAGAALALPATFRNRYGGAALGLFVPLFVVIGMSANEYQNIPPIIFIALFLGPPLIGYAVQNWWNKQDFVIEAKRKKAAEDTQRDLARQAEIRTQAEAQQRALDEAALKAKLDAIQPVPKTPTSPSSPLSPAAQKIADEIARRRKP